MIKTNLCENAIYELKLLLLKIFHLYDDWKNPPCVSCGVKKSA